jgi:hypothetical protein
MYKLSRYPDQVIRIADAAVIPTDPRNVDYQAVLAWIAAGNTLAPADQADINEGTRIAALDATIASFSFGGKTLAELKAMDSATFDTWWTANVTTLAQANTVLKLLARAVLRRVL